MNISFEKRNKLLRKNLSIIPFIQLSIDCIISALILISLTLFKTGEVSIQYSALITISILLIFIVYNNTGQYRINKSFVNVLFVRFKAWVYVVFILFCIGFITKGMSYYSREVIVGWIILTYISQIINYYFFLKINNKITKKYKHSLVIGGNKTAQKLISSINKNTWITHEIVGYIDDKKSQYITDVDYLGDFNKIDDIIDENDIKIIYISLPSYKTGEIEDLYLKFMLKDIEVRWVPDVVSLNLINHHVVEISGLPILTLSSSPITGINLIFKSIFDIVSSSIILIVMSPLLFIIAIFIKLSSPGPILFTQERHGVNNKIFKIYKFRSMKVHQEKNGQITQARKNDDRMTAIGCFIRRTSIDELPQLLNVLKGDMSLVGPRPHAVLHNNHFQEKINHYMARHKIKPGITGLAQVTGFRGETDTLDKMRGRVQKDMIYINNWSLSFDIEIIFRTIVTLFSDKAY